MLITRLELVGFKPLIHRRIRTIDIVMTSRTQVIIGQNGSGKSSIMREMTPLPATRTDYESDGKKIIELTHDNVSYCLTSDFSEAKAHSFCRDGIELNISGTTDVQTELCMKHLGVTTLINHLTNFSKRVCSMSKGERKDFLIAVHPSNIYFLLEKHKKVSSELRGFNSNLKMLNERATELKSYVMDKESISILKSTKDDLDNLASMLDQLIFVVSKEIQDWSLKLNSTNINHFQCILNIQQECEQYLLEVSDLKRNHGDLFSVNDIEFIRYKTAHVLETNERQMKQIEASCQDLRSKLETDEKRMNSETKECLQKVEIDIKTIEELISNIHIDPDMETIPELELDEAKSTLVDKMHNAIITIRDSGKAWSSKLIYIAHERVTLYTNKVCEMDKEIEKLDVKIQEVKQRINFYENKTYPGNCDLACNLKSGRDDLLENLRNSCSELSTRMDTLIYQKTILLRKITRLNLGMSEPLKSLSSIEYLESMFNWKRWLNPILGNESLIKILNTRPLTIIDRLNRMITNSEMIYRQNNLLHQLDALKFKHRTLSDASIPTMEYLTQTILENKMLIQTHIDEYKCIERESSNLSAKLKNISLVKKYMSQLEDIVSRFEKHSKDLILQRHIDFYRSLLSDYRSYRNAVSDKLIDVNKSIKEQDAYATRLDEEITPLIKSMETKIKRWSAIETQLSPSKGLPHTYMVRYLNSVIDLVNMYIRNVWSHELEVSNISEINDLSFLFPFSVNKSGDIKDISLGSNAQKEMIDLAFTLSIMKHLGIGNVHPVRLDEPDSGFSNGHRTKLLELLGKMMRDGDLSQLFLVNHHFAGYTALDAETLVLSDEDIMIPDVYNEHVTITYD